MNYSQGPEDQPVWLVKIAGLYNQDSALAMWRTLKNASAYLGETHLLARSFQRSQDQDGHVINWYDIYIADFAEQDKAMQWCDALREENIRCLIEPAANLQGDAIRIDW